MKSYLFLIFATVFWGCNFFYAAHLVSYTNVYESAFWRYAFGLGTLFIFLLRDIPSKEEMKKIGYEIILIGFFGLFVFNVLFFKGMELSSPINAALIIGLNPALTLLFSRFVLKIEIKIFQIIGIIFAFLGVVYLIQKGNFNFENFQFSSGDLFILAACILFASYNVSVKKYGNNIKNIHFTFVTNLACFLSFLILFPFIKTGDISSYPFSFWASCFGIGALGTGLAYIFWNYSVQDLGAPKAGIFMNLVPVSSVVITVFLGNPIYSFHYVSGFLVVFGIVCMQRGQKWFEYIFNR